jgi:hypothetical protein
MMRRIWVFLLSLPILALPGLSPAITADVDVALAFLVDVSGSVDQSEFELQRDGYVAAFRNEDVLQIIDGGRSIAATLMYWAGDGIQQQAIDWTVIDSRASAEVFAAAVGGTSQPSLPSGSGPQVQTAVSQALTAGRQLFEGNEFFDAQLVIDISGDGSENFDLLEDDSFVTTINLEADGLMVDVGFGPITNWGEVVPARQAALDAGITINALPILSGLELDMSPAAEAFGIARDGAPVLPAPFDVLQGDLDAQWAAEYDAFFAGDPTRVEWFYANYVIGVPDGTDGEPILITAVNFESFAEAITQKVAAEIAPEPATGLLLLFALGALGRARARN